MSKAIEIRLATGDVERLRVERRGLVVRLAVYQRPEPKPLIHAVLSEDECAELVRALGQRGCIVFRR